MNTALNRGIDELSQWCTSNGVGFPLLKPDEWVRTNAPEKKHSNKSLAIIQKQDCVLVHDHILGISRVFPSVRPRYNRQEQAQLFREAQERRLKAEAKIQALQDLRARQAMDIWRASNTNGTHPYITTKQLSGLHNAQIETSSGALLVPMRLANVELVNLQMIYPNGFKRFMAGARVKGAYSVIGSLHNAERVLICEGWATGASLFELYKLPVVVAFNAGNLMPVCQSLRSRFEKLSVVIAGDDDRQNLVNVGRKKAIEAAESIGATLLFPELCKACTCTDWNDLSICNGRRAHE